MSIFGEIVRGIGSALTSRASDRSRASSDREMSDREMAFEREAIGLRAGEDRRTQKEAALLDEWMRQNRRSEIARGAKNFTQFAGSEFRGRTFPSPANTQQVTPDVFVERGGLIGNLAAPVNTAPRAAGGT